ncbi:MAG: ATP-binding protein [Anaerolineaceae bacterium]
MAGKDSRKPYLNDNARKNSKIDLKKMRSDMDAALFSELAKFVDQLSLVGGLLVVENKRGEIPLFSQIEMSDDWFQDFSDENGLLRRLLQTPERIQLEEPEGAIVYPFVFPEGRKGLFLTRSGLSFEVDEYHLNEMAGRILKIIDFQNESQNLEYSSGLDFIAKIAASLNNPYHREESELEMMAGLCQLFNCEAGSLAIWDDEQDTFLIKKTYTTGPSWAFQGGIQPDRGLVGECMKTNRLILTNHPESNLLFQKEVDAFPTLRAHNLLIAPMIKDGGLVNGIIALQNKKGGFSDDDVTKLRHLTNTLSRLISNQRTNQQLRVANAHLEASRWELVRSRNTLRSLFDNIPDSTYIIDSKYRMIAINLARAKRADCEPRSVIGTLCYKSLYNREQPCANCMVGETFFDKRITHRTERIWENVESPQEWDVSVYPILDESDQVVQVILFEQDLTEKRNMDAILAQSEKMAAVGQLAAGIAHEINNPLTVILANAQLLTRDLNGNADALEAVDLISKAGTRALQVVRNLLNFARKEQFDLKDTDINDTILHALEMLRHETLERDAEIKFEPTDHLPLIKASQDNLQGVWLNILLNAMDSAGEKKPKIRITTAQSGSEIRVVISDNGVGIPPENLKRIFDPFFTTKGAGRGTGLGLSICHRIIKQHGGHILVDSLKDQGTTFSIFLPVY